MDDAQVCDLYSTMGVLEMPMGRRAWVPLRSIGVNLCGAASSANLGGSSNYSNENFEDWSGEGFHVYRISALGESILRLRGRSFIVPRPKGKRVNIPLPRAWPTSGDAYELADTHTDTGESSLLSSIATKPRSRVALRRGPVDRRALIGVQGPVNR